jgi:ankyrin repeat protein
MMKDLIAAGCGTELRDAQRRTPFLIAVAAGQEDAVRLLASDHILHTSDFCGSRTVAAVDVNACDSCGNSALMLAALYDDVTLGRTLLDIGCCNTNAQNINGKTAKDLTLSPEFRVVLSSAVTAEHRDELLD